MPRKYAHVNEDQSQGAKIAERAVAIADIYVTTNTIRDLLEWRLVAVQRAIAYGASEADVVTALEGAA